MTKIAIRLNDLMIITTCLTALITISSCASSAPTLGNADTVKDVQAVFPSAIDITKMQIDQDVLISGRPNIRECIGFGVPSSPSIRGEWCSWSCDDIIHVHWNGKRVCPIKVEREDLPDYRDIKYLYSSESGPCPFCTYQQWYESSRYIKCFRPPGYWWDWI